MKKRIFVLLSILLLLSSNLTFSQFTQNDSALVRTTFLREFDKDIIYQYLSSNDSTKIHAALLSISHSEDTTFVDSVIKLDFNNYGDYISFALGQLGESKKSEDYLYDSAYVPFKDNYIEALGLCGDSLTLDFLMQTIDSISDSHYSPVSSITFPIVIANFYSRGITNERSLEYLVNNLKKIPQNLKLLDEYKANSILISIYNNERALNTAYALYRLGSSKEAIPELIKYLNNDYYHQTKLYALGNFRKLKYFPDDPILLSNLVNSDSWRIRTETANSACYYPFSSKGEIGNYIYLVLDNNPNVSRTAAIALKNIKYPKDQIWIKHEIEALLQNQNLTKNTRGELLISYASLFKIATDSLVNVVSQQIEPKFIYRLLADNISNPEFNFKYLNERIINSSEIELLDLLPAYLTLQNKYLNNKEYASYLFTVLKGNKTSSVSIIADGLELPIIKQNKEVLQEIILEQIFNHKNDTQFSETIISLANLANRVDNLFYESVIDMLSSSMLNSIKKYALEKQGLKFEALKDDALFIRLWSSAFKYKFAYVETNKGNFTIELKPEFAPMTCGNFITLAEKGFYNGVIFHRVVPNFVIQTGDTTNTGWGGPGYEIVSEFSPLPFDRAAVGIASIGKDTEGSQWFVMHSNYPHLNGRYTNWANVIEGMEIVDIIDEGDRVISIKFAK